MNETSARLTGHLTEEQFAEATLGEPLAADAQAHVAGCAACRGELVEFGNALGEFRLASRAWSEAVSEGMPAIRPAGKPARTGALGGMAPAYAWAAAGLLAVGATVPLVEHARHQQEAAPAVARVDEDSSGMNSPEQIVRDNQLLTEVHFELTRADLPGSAPTARQGRERTQP